jgi:biotin operon repressor
MIRFFAGENVGVSSNSLIDHIGFSFANLEAKVAELEATGIKVTMPVRGIPGLFKIAFVKDPLGGRIELA